MQNSKKRKMLQPAYGLWKMYRPEDAKHAFRATARREANHWQKRTRGELDKTVGFQDMPHVPLLPEQLENVDKGDYVRQKFLLRTSRDTLMPVYILLPKKADRPLPIVMAFHGHGYGVKDIVGLWEDGSERNTPDGYHADFAISLCRAGFAVAAPEIACFGERVTDFSYLQKLGSPAPSTCAHAGFLAFHMDKSVVGMRVFEVKRLIDYLERRKDIDADKLGAMGISGGGMLTFFSTCLDTRIKACVVSGYFSMFKDSILAMHHCPCNFVPGLSQFGEIADLAGLIAPRPMLIESGTRDEIFPIESVKAGVRQARKVYKVFGAEQNIETSFFEGRHRINGIQFREFFLRKL